MSIFDKKANIESFISTDALNARKYGLEVLVANAKEDIASYEEQLKAIADRLKDFATDTVTAVQDKVEEVVEVVKEEVKKAAPKKAAKKTEEEVVVEEPKVEEEKSSK